MRLNIKNFYTTASSFIVACLFTIPVKAQLNPFGAMYFQNQYLNNPAMAGLADGFVANLGYRQQFSSIQGSPQTQALTAEYGTGKKVAFGLNLNNEKAGIIGRTRVMGTYAYHLPLSGENQHLNFGISFGFTNERLDNAEINGDAGDMSIGRYNDRKTYADGDFGAAYTSNSLTVQGAIPNLKQFFNKDEGNLGADRSLYMAAISYKIAKAFSGIGIEPKVVLRGVRGYDSLLDAGANLTFANNSLNLLGMYHSSQSATFGAGMNFKNNFSVLGIYTTNTSDLSSYTNGNFEIALKMNFLK